MCLLIRILACWLYHLQKNYKKITISNQFNIALSYSFKGVIASYFSGERKNLAGISVKIGRGCIPGKTLRNWRMFLKSANDERLRRSQQRETFDKQFVLTVTVFWIPFCCMATINTPQTLLLLNLLLAGNKICILRTQTQLHWAEINTSKHTPVTWRKDYHEQVAVLFIKNQKA